MKSIVCLLLSINLISPAFAEDVTLLKEGQPAPWAGFLLTREKVEKVYKLDLDLQLQTKQSEIYSQQLKLTQDQLERNNKFIDEQSKRIVSMQENSIWTKIGFFVIGSVITGAIAYGVTTTLK